MKALSTIKAILSAFIWGSGQALNRQYIKALFFFIIFVGFVGTELLTSSYFEETSEYTKLVGNDLTDLWYQETLYGRYLEVKNQNNTRLNGFGSAGYEPFEDFLRSINISDNATDKESLSALNEINMLQFIADDLRDRNLPTVTNLTTSEEILASDFDLTVGTLIERRGVLFVDEDGTYYIERNIELEDGSNQKEFVETSMLYGGLNETNILLSNVGLIRFEKLNEIYEIDNVFYLRVRVDESFRFINLLTEEVIASIEMDNNRVPIEGPMYIIDDTFYEYYEAGMIYLSQRLQYEETPFTRVFRQTLYYDYSADHLDYSNADFNRIMVRVYLNLNPELKETFETQYNNFFYDQAGFFIRSYWSVGTLGVAQKVNFTNHMSLAEAIAGQGLSKDDFSLFTTPGFQLSENIPIQGHVSTMILLEGLIGVISSLFFFIFMTWGILDAYRVSEQRRKEEKVLKDIDYFKDVYERSYEYIILSPAIFVLAFISIMPIVFGFMIAFTNIAGNESMLDNFDYVGFRNFIAIFDFSSGLGQSFGQAFWRVLGWTVVWAILSTATVFFGGFFQALILNSEKVVFRKFWRTLFILPWAIPALLSQMVFSVMFKELGFINQFLKDLGVYDILFDLGMLGVNYESLSGIRTLFYLGLDNIQWFTNPFNTTFVRGSIVFINIWLGFPYFMALMTGVMTAIDKTLYEAADIDGASGWQKIRLITMPLVLYSTAPILIMTFSGNFNNFGVIYFITGGGPNDGKPSLGFAGDTDILISWMYKLTVDYSIYNMASVFSVLIFLFVGSITAWNLSRTRAFQED
jgi:arabinogalactan oligomer / maltooligosaccharide transport system permease protein